MNDIHVTRNQPLGHERGRQRANDDVIVTVGAPLCSGDDRRIADGVWRVKQLRAEVAKNSHEYEDLS
jgi:hypothetical protein